MPFSLCKWEKKAKRNCHYHVEHDLPCGVSAPIHIIGKGIKVNRIRMIKNERQSGYNGHQREKQHEREIDIHGGVHQKNVFSSCFPVSAKEKNIQCDQGEKVDQYFESHIDYQLQR